MSVFHGLSAGNVGQAPLDGGVVVVVVVGAAVVVVVVGFAVVVVVVGLAVVVVSGLAVVVVAPGPPPGWHDAAEPTSTHATTPTARTTAVDLIPDSIGGTRRPP